MTTPSSADSSARFLPRVALIGVSGYGRIHVQLLRECLERGEVKLAAAVVINPDEERAVVEEFRAHGCTIYSSYEEMFARERGRLDLCLIPTGIHWHAPMTIAALRAGANVLVEKPLAATLSEAEEVARVEHETDRFVAVGFQDYYESTTQWLKERVHGGAIGQLESVRFLGIWPRPRGYYLRNNWAGKIHADGRFVMDSPLNNAFGHFAMLALYLAGAERDMAASVEIENAQLYRAREIESFDTGVVRMTTAGATKLWFGVTHSCIFQRDPELLLVGSKGRATWSYESEVKITNGRADEEIRALADTTAARRDMIAAVLRRLKEGEGTSATPLCSPAIALRHTAFIEQLHANWPICDFPADLVKWSSGEAGDSVPVVRGLESALRAAYTSGSDLQLEGGGKHTAASIAV